MLFRNLLMLRLPPRPASMSIVEEPLPKYVKQDRGIHIVDFRQQEERRLPLHPRRNFQNLSLDK